MPREQIIAPGHDRNRSLGHLALWWIEQWCVHGPGDVEGEPVELDDEFAGYILDCYALDQGGRRLYDSAFLSRPKGRAKSELAAFIALFEAFGPCRFARWAAGGETFRWHGHTYVYEAGDPIGRAIAYPYIRCLATEENQAGNTYDNIYYNLTEGPLGQDLPGDAAGLTRTLLPQGGEIVPSTASNAAKDGGKETHVVFDETHLYITPELRRMYATVRRNLAKRRSAEGWSHETSTMYLPGEDSVAESTHGLAKSIREGKTRRPRLLFDHVEAASDVDLADEKQLRAALREVYGPFADVMDLDRLISEIWDPRNSTQDSRRYFLNRPTESLDSWLSSEEWGACAKPELVVSPRDLVVLGFDGSRSRARQVTDATALVACRVSDGHTWLVHAWEQPDGPAGRNWRVPVDEVDAEVRAAFATWRVVGMYADPAKWETYIATWEADFGHQLKIRASRANPIEWWITGGRSQLIVRAIKQLHGAVLDREMSHDGGSVLTRHVLNARRRPTRAGMQITKEHPDSARKIDAAVAAVLAWQARLDALAAGVLEHAAPQGYTPFRIR